ncbi:MAG: hypothetical protein AB4290_27110 [Spirulina sp.]
MMLKLFRSRYPQGSLVSELLQFEQGKYVVRVTIHCDRMVLGTGLGAADTVEEAEDRARERALALLNLEGTPSLPEGRSLNGDGSHLLRQSSTTALPFSGEGEKLGMKEARMQVLPSQSPVSPQNISHFSTSSTPSTPPTPPTPTPEPPIAPFEDAIVEETVMRSPDPEPLDFDFPPSEPTFPAPPPETQSPPVSVEPPPAPVEAPSPPPKIQALTEPIDFSEVLAQTNIEIRRLQWTQEQGRKFLLERYGKRSRQVLTDEELLDFLEYLKSQ